MNSSAATTHEQAAALLQAEHNVMQTYARTPVEFVRGSGMELFDSTGKSYLDFLAGIGTVNLGHANEAVAEAVCAQMHKLVHVSNLFYVEHRAELATKLAGLSISPLSLSSQSSSMPYESLHDSSLQTKYTSPESIGDAQTFFTNSGTEAVEGALKLARKWGHLHKPHAQTIVTAHGSFHGRTYGALSATGQPERAVPFAPTLPGFAYTTFNDATELETHLTQNTVAFMIEVIQGESGVWPATQEYLDKAATLCKEHNILLIVDEIQTGIYRTGLPFAFQHYGIEPDIITSAKGLGNGFPIGAVIARTDVAAAFVPGDHGTTFGGGPVACAAALTTLNELARLSIDRRTLEEHVAVTGAYLRTRLTDIPYLTDVRGVGLMVGATLTAEMPLTAPQLRDALCEAGFIVNAIGDDHLRLLPPLICKNMHIDRLIEQIYAIIERQKEKT
ncbi:MAG: acetylornithine/succinylornithine family transaminase [Coriobacteriia bacterium]|nr:acetylornithine/succinylornithine family transaminase [Coriobacteriia bacterium]